MLLDLGVNWVPARIGFDRYNPHPDMQRLPAEAVFVGTGSGNPQAFDRRDVATAGLQEVLFLYPGCLAPASPDRFVFEPLLSTGPLSGVASFFDVVRPTPSGLALNASFVRQSGKEPNVLAAHVRSKPGVALAGGAKPVNIIAVADLDFIADNFFDIRASAALNASFDNITFFLNAMDELAADESFIALRNHHVPHRTLARVETQTRAFMERRRRDEQQADADAQTALTGARNRLKARVEDINQRRDLDTQAKQIMTRTLEETEDRRLRVLEANIESEKDKRILASRETMEAQVRRIRGTIRAIAVLLPPIPVLLLGVITFVKRKRREDAGMRAVGRLKEPR
jgi:ABC-2 type transport system permease protein